MSWETVIGEPYDNRIEIFNDDANTGWFNQGFNDNPIDATLVQGISEISYCDETIATFVIDSSATDFAFGGSYVSGLDNYFKNKPESASKYAMTLGSVLMNVGQSYVSQSNDDGAKWFFETLSVITNGTEHTFNVKITPNPAFETFIGGRSEGDRTLYLWCKVGLSLIHI